MSKTVRAIMAALLTVGFMASAAAQTRPTLEDAKVLVKKARAYIHEVGAQKAYAEFSNPKGKFVDRDMYIYVYDKNLVNLAHGLNPRMVGKDLSELRDPDGNLINRGLLEAAQKGNNVFKFKFVNPTTHRIESKTGYAEMDGDVMVGSGVYTPN